MRIQITDNTTSNGDITNTTFINKPRDVPLFDIKISDILCECESLLLDNTMANDNNPVFVDRIVKT